MTPDGIKFTCMPQVATFLYPCVHGTMTFNAIRFYDDRCELDINFFLLKMMLNLTHHMVIVLLSHLMLTGGVTLAILVNGVNYGNGSHLTHKTQLPMLGV